MAISTIYIIISVPVGSGSGKDLLYIIPLSQVAFHFRLSGKLGSMLNIFFPLDDNLSDPVPDLYFVVGFC
jgi:hypothetical protein